MPEYPFFGFQPPELTEEQKAALDRQEMHMDEFRHSFQRLFDELPEDQLITLKTMLSWITQTNHEALLAATWEGMASYALKSRFNICITCGVNHDKEIQPHPHAEEESEKFHDIPLVQFYELSADEQQLMEQYHLDDVREEGSNELLRFMCTGINGMKEPCGMTYPTIEDRMLKGPENCSGCFQKMGHG